MKARIGAFQVARLTLITVAGLSVPTVLGRAIDLRYDTAPWALLAGALIGIIVATFGVTWLVLRRYAQLAPRSSTEEQDKWQF